MVYNMVRFVIDRNTVIGKTRWVEFSFLSPPTCATWILLNNNWLILLFKLLILLLVEM